MEQQITHVKKKPKKSRVRNFPLVIIGVILLVYILVQVISAFSNGIQTVPAKHVSVNDSFTAQAYFVRNEHIVTGTASESAKHSVNSGERVQAGSPLATMYVNEESLTLSDELDQVTQEIAKLNSILQMTEGEVDTAKLDQLIAIELQDYFAAVKNGSGSAVSSEIDSLRSLSLRRMAGTLDESDIEAQRTSLLASQSSIQQQLGNNYEQITAPASGYFSEVIDGYESIFTVDVLSDLTPETFAALCSQNPSSISDTSFGKIIEGFTWYLAMEVPLEDVTGLSVGENIEVEIKSASMQIPVTVYAINKSTNKSAETTVLLLEGSVFNSELVSMRSQNIEVILNTYTGLEVPKVAVRLQESSDGSTQTGVFILSGTFTSFKTIEILYESDSFYVVKQTAIDKYSLVAQDKIVVQGKDIQNNMVVKT